MPVWNDTDEPCHLMYSSFSSPFISKNFALSIKIKKKPNQALKQVSFSFQSFILQHALRRKINHKSYGKFLLRDVCACCM